MRSSSTPYTIRFLDSSLMGMLDVLEILTDEMGLGWEKDQIGGSE